VTSPLPYAHYNADGSLIADAKLSQDFVSEEVRSLAVKVTSAEYSSGSLNTCLCMGDSRIAQAFPNSGLSYGLTTYPCTINFMLGKRFNFVQSVAVTGASIDTVISTQLPVLQRAPIPQFVMMEIGYNDWATNTAAQFIAKYITLRDAILVTGTTLIAFTDQAGSTLTALQRIRQQVFNSWLMGSANQIPRMIVIDAYGATVGNQADSSIGVLHSTYRQTDTIHTNVNGSFAVAREAFPVLDPIIPKIRPFGASIGAHSQLVYNPNVEGDNASGANGWTAAAGITGNGPNYWNALRSGTATATTSVILRSASSYVSDGRKGNLLNVAFTGGSANDSVTVSPAATTNIRILPWAFSGFSVGYRIKPTIPNGCHYLVTVAGTTANAGDPTGSYSTIIGTTFTDGTVTLLVVPSIDAGDTVQFMAEVFGGGLTGQISVRCQIEFLTSGFASLGVVDGGYTDAALGQSSYLPTAQVIHTPPAIMPATTAIIAARLIINGSAGATATIQFGQCELRKIGI